MLGYLFMPSGYRLSSGIYEELVFLFKSIAYIKMIYLCMMAGLFMVFIITIRYSNNKTATFTILYDKIIHFYKKEKDQQKTFKELFYRNVDLAYLVRYYFVDSKKLDAILERILTPDSIRKNMYKTSRFYPQLNDVDIERRYLMTRKDNKDDKFMLLVAIYGICLLYIYGCENYHYFDSHNKSISGGEQLLIIFVFIWIIFLIICPNLAYWLSNEYQKNHITKMAYSFVVITSWVFLTMR